MTFIQAISFGIKNTWLHTRAGKYNLSALGTCFEREGVKCTYFSRLYLVTMEMFVDCANKYGLHDII